MFKKHRLSQVQFYEFIHELNVAGSVLGKRVLDPKKYAKVDVKEVIRFAKKPHLFSHRIFDEYLYPEKTIFDYSRIYELLIIRRLIDYSKQPYTADGLPPPPPLAPHFTK